LIEAGHVTRNGAPLTDPSESVRGGARYVLEIPPAAPATPQAQAIPLTILFEDADLIVVDKPAGLVVHPAPGNPDGTLVNALLAHAGDDLPGIGGEKRPGIVHRLDKDTSGVMVATKTDRAHRALSEAFAARDLDRAYLALVWGLPDPATGTIDAALARSERNREKIAVVREGRGRHAITHYPTEAALGEREAVGLVRCRLETGRTHQIRVHAAEGLRLPLLGDPVYGRKDGRAPRTITHAERLALALSLLEDARFDALLGPATPFDELPAALPALLAAGGAGCPVVTY